MDRDVLQMETDDGDDDFNFDKKYDLPYDFYIKIGLTINHENKWVEGASDSDLHGFSGRSSSPMSESRKQSFKWAIFKNLCSNCSKSPV